MFISNTLLTTPQVLEPEMMDHEVWLANVVDPELLVSMVRLLSFGCKCVHRPLKYRLHLFKRKLRRDVAKGEMYTWTCFRKKELTSCDYSDWRSAEQVLWLLLPTCTTSLQRTRRVSPSTRSPLDPLLQQQQTRVTFATTRFANHAGAITGEKMSNNDLCC